MRRIAACLPGLASGLAFAVRPDPMAPSSNQSAAQSIYVRSAVIAAFIGLPCVMIKILTVGERMYYERTANGVHVAH